MGWNIAGIKAPKVADVVGLVIKELAGEVPLRTMSASCSRAFAIISRARGVSLLLYDATLATSFDAHPPSPSQNRNPQMCLIAKGRQPNQTNTTRQNLSHIVRFLRA